MKRWTRASFLGVLLIAISSCNSGDAPQGSKPEITKPGLSAPQADVVPKPGAVGSIVGMVKYAGTPPAPRLFRVNKDNDACGSEKKSEGLVVGSGQGIQWVVVSLEGVKVAVRPNRVKPVLDQKTCQFQPHVLLVYAGEEVDILNPDGVLHNIHTFSSANPPINKAQPKFKKVMTERFEKPELIRVQCDAHSWMAGWIYVTNQLSGVTDVGGNFRITDVPEGTHVLRLWHETLGEYAEEVIVLASKETKVLIQANPKGFSTVKSPTAKVRGEAPYTTYCVMCHGLRGKGDGEGARALVKKPADLTSLSVRTKSENDLSRAIVEGKPQSGMPPWGGVLSQEQVRDLVSYIKNELFKK